MIENNIKRIKLLEEKAQRKAEIKEQTAKLRVDAENALTVAKQELAEKYKTDLASFQKDVEALKLDSSNELRTILADITNLKLQYQYETDQLSQNYELNLGQAEHSLQLERDKAEKYKSELDRVTIELENSKGDHKSEVFHMETKMKHLNQSLVADSEKYKKLKSEKSEEIDKLAKKVRELQAELTLKTEVAFPGSL